MPPELVMEFIKGGRSTRVAGRWTGLILGVICLLAATASAQYETPASLLAINGSRASTWVEESTNIILVEGPVQIDLDGTRMSSNSAVVWVTPMSGLAVDQMRVEIVLVGNAQLQQPNQAIITEKQRLYVDGHVRGVIRVAAGEKPGENRADADLYRFANSARPLPLKPGQDAARWLLEDDLPTTQPATRPAGQFRPLRPVSIRADQFGSTLTVEGKVAAVFSGSVILLQKDENGDFLELRADHAVVFTAYSNLGQIQQGQAKSIEDAVVGAYLEGDVRINRTPASAREPSQSLKAAKTYYDFTTDRAVLTDVILHTADPGAQIPIIVRARTLRQLSVGEYSAEKARLSTSSFATPSYSMGASRAYMRQYDSGTELGSRTDFIAHNTTFDLGPVPVFYFPVVAGSFTQKNAIRNVETSGSNGFGFGLSTELGLFESFGRLPPRGTDFSYQLDYFSKRGPGFGFDGNYTGGRIDETTLDPWSFKGDFTSYLVYDHGEDKLGRRRNDVEPDDELRGRFYWEHQHFFPGDWQVQLSGGYISDPTFLEEWFNKDFRTSRPLDTALYVKRQRDTEAFTFLTSVQPNDFATVAEVYQEQAEIERLGELGYRRIGDSILEDTMTFYSTNSLSALRFRQSDSTLEDLGFRTVNGGVGRYSPGYASYGWTGTDEDMTLRGDFRQEVTWPFSVGRFRAVPYVVGRYTDYSESVDGSGENRLYSSAGLRLTTGFWKVDDTVEPKFYDIHRLRHVIDAITDISAVNLALRQRWQTKRGGPGRWRSVDFFNFNLAYTHYFNEPPDAELEPRDFRGLWFVSIPEASAPRTGFTADAVWRISDAFEFDTETHFNTEESELATTAFGFTVRHAPRVSYYLGYRHIGLDFEREINGNTFVFERQDLVLFSAHYDLTRKYQVSLSNSYDLAQQRNDRSTVSVIRHFDRFYASISVRVDKIDDESAVFFNVWPEGLAPGGGSQAARGGFAN
jgi:lipopolysaccharide assembly outer membrane protein LptD (OstA)